MMPASVETATGKSAEEESSARTHKQKKEANRKPIEKLPKPEVSWQSDSSCVAILRSSSEPDADTLTLEWHSSSPQVMIAAAGVPILAGNWNWSVQLDDEVLPSPTAWKCSCWFLDPETVFVELEAEDAAAVKQVRQLLLAPCDRFAMMTDSVTSQRPGTQSPAGDIRAACGWRIVFNVCRHAGTDTFRRATHSANVSAVAGGRPNSAHSGQLSGTRRATGTCRSRQRGRDTATGSGLAPETYRSAG